MKKIEIFISEDHKEFDNALQCADHEISSCPGVLQSIEKAVAKKPSSHQSHWCNSQACACMGCINHEFLKAGLSKEHWQVWNEKYRIYKKVDVSAADIQDLNEDASYDVVLQDAGVNKSGVMKTLREIKNFNLLEVFEIIKKKDTIIFTNVDKYIAKEAQKALQKQGATVKIEEKA